MSPSIPDFCLPSSWTPGEHRLRLSVLCPGCDPAEGSSRLLTPQGAGRLWILIKRAFAFAAGSRPVCVRNFRPSHVTTTTSVNILGPHLSVFKDKFGARYGGSGLKTQLLEKMGQEHTLNARIQGPDPGPQEALQQSSS